MSNENLDMAGLLERNHLSLDALRDAYANGNLTLYLGAGISMDNGFQSWNALVIAMYVRAV